MAPTRHRLSALRCSVAVALLAAALVAGLVAAATPADAAFLGANGKIAFESQRGGNGEIYVVNADGTGQTNPTNNPTADSGSAWSPDGTKITFSTNRDSPVEPTEIWGMVLIIGGAVVMIVLWVWEKFMMGWNAGAMGLEHVEDRSFFDTASAWKQAVFVLGGLCAVVGVIVLFATPLVGSPEAGDPCAPGEPPPPGFECR